MYGVQVAAPIGDTSAIAVTLNAVPLISAAYLPARAGKLNDVTGRNEIGMSVASTMRTVSRPSSAGVVASASRMCVALVNTSVPAARFESAALNVHCSAMTSIDPSSDIPHGSAGSSHGTQSV